MTAVSQFPAIVDGVLSTLRAAPSLASVTVSDGLPITEDRFNDLVIIGNSGDPENTEAGMIQQEYHDLAGVSSSRDETVSINCCVLAQTGDVDVSATRARAFQVLGYVSDALRANYGLGLSNVIRVELSDVTVIVDQFADGTAVRLPFTISGTSII